MKKSLIILITVLMLSINTTNANFTDISPNTEEATAIKWMEANDIVVGYADNKFHPEQAVSRVEFLKMLYKTLDIELKYKTANSEDQDSQYKYTERLANNQFTDVPNTEEWYSIYLAEAYNEKVVSGYPDNSFKPSQSIHLDEASKIISNAFFNTDKVYPNTYTAKYGHCLLDTSGYKGQWFEKYITILDESCIYPINIIDTKTYHPSLELTRGQIAILLYKARAVLDNTGGKEHLVGYTPSIEAKKLLDENQFVFNAIEKNDKIKDWTLSAIGSDGGAINENNFALYFLGEVEITGEYYWDGFKVCMKNLDSNSKTNIPIATSDITNKSDFCFIDSDTEKFQAKGSIGTATIIAKSLSYKYHAYNNEAIKHNYITLQEVINIEELPEEDTTNLCESEAKISDIGSSIYPINQKYEPLFYLGQLFTADDCNGDRINKIFGVNDNKYTAGSNLSLYNAPSTELIATLLEIGYKCKQENNSNESCTKWELNKEVELEKILELKEYYDNMLRDDCVNCG